MPFFMVCYQNLKKLSFTAKIVFSEKPPSLCLGVFTDIMQNLAECTLKSDSTLFHA